MSWLPQQSVVLLPLSAVKFLQIIFVTNSEQNFDHVDANCFIIQFELLKNWFENFLLLPIFGSNHITVVSTVRSILKYDINDELKN